MVVESILAPFMQQAETYGPDHNASGDNQGC